jgi:hypothetical protein
VLYGVLRENPVVLDEDNLATVFCEVENIVNSRPITVTSSDHNDPVPLSPNQILTGKLAVTLPPMGEFQRNDVYMRKRWRRTQYLLNVFWSRWRKEFLSGQQPRAKWQNKRRDYAPGDVVLIREDSPRSSWPMGVVNESHADRHGVVRHVSLRSRVIILKRPVHKLVLLLASKYDNDDE